MFQAISLCITAYRPNASFGSIYLCHLVSIRSGFVPPELDLGHLMALSGMRRWLCPPVGELMSGGWAAERILNPIRWAHARASPDPMLV